MRHLTGPYNTRPPLKVVQANGQVTTPRRRLSDFWLGFVAGGLVVSLVALACGGYLR